MTKRAILTCLVLLLVSALLNLALAIGFWWFGERPPPPNPMMFDPRIVVDPRPRDLTVWRNRRGPDWPQEPQAASRHNSLGITFRSMVWNESEWSGSPDDVESKITKQDSYSIDIVESGWPLRCIAGERWNEYHGQSGPYQSTSGMFVAFGAQWPNRVLWLGMLMNEVFYGEVVVLSFEGWIQGRRAIRRRRGRCRQCAYDLRGNFGAGGGGGCPECGRMRDDGHNACGYSSAAGSN
ncbi:MAG: hypothetical protein V3T84_08530 [Phycisphaerales bacterium]